MQHRSILAANTNPKLSPCPINADWILEGTPTASLAVLSNSSDRLSCAVIWECTAGKFNWFYDFDETIHFLEGSCVIDDGKNGPRSFGPGDVIFIPKGAAAHWTIETRVRKLAYCQKVMPGKVQSAMQLMRAVKRLLSGSKAQGEAIPSLR